MHTFFPWFGCLVIAMPLAAENLLDPRLTPEVLEAFAPYTYEHAGFTLPYRMMRPLEQQQGEHYPLVLFLHGYGERGDDNLKQLLNGGQVMASEALRKTHPAFFVAPQCPAGTEPGTVDPDPTLDTSENPRGEARRFWTWWQPRPDSPKVDVNGPTPPQLAAVRALVEKLKGELPIDPDRVYIMGLSMGGYATWELVLRDPTIYAAAVPICGAGDPSQGERLTSLPIWVFHGEADSVIPVKHARDMVGAIRAAGGNPISTEYPGVGHNSWTPTFASQQVWDWLFAQRREQ